MTRLSAILVAALAAATAVVGSWQAQPAPTVERGHAFSGSWTASGTRHTIPTASGQAAIVRMSGTIVLASGQLGRGFRAEAIAFGDGETAGVGRAVWVDGGGDRIYSELVVEPIGTGRRIAGTITGGTGRYAGVSGDYTFTWRYVVTPGGSEVQGHTTDLAGRVLIGRGPS